MKSEEIIKILKDDQDNIDFEWLKEEAQPIFDAYSEAIKAVEVIDKIKQAYAENSIDFGEMVYDIMCNAYGSDTNCESWVWDCQKLQDMSKAFQDLSRQIDD